MQITWRFQWDPGGPDLDATVDAPLSRCTALESNIKADRWKAAALIEPYTHVLPR
jgi:hypothetical protein